MQKDAKILTKVLEAHPDKKFSFTMCNPPFFDSDELASHQKHQEDDPENQGDER